LLAFLLPLIMSFTSPPRLGFPRGRLSRTRHNILRGLPSCGRPPHRARRCRAH
jgi:hypothetical protein